MNTRIGDPEKSDRDCEIRQPSHVISTIIMYYIRKIGIIDIILIIIVYNVILFSHWFPDAKWDTVEIEHNYIELIFIHTST